MQDKSEHKKAEYGMGMMSVRMCSLPSDLCGVVSAKPLS